jgi:uncharacterized membrane protein
MGFGERLAWPVGRHRSLYLGYGAAGILAALVVWGMVAAASSGDPSPLRYLPVVNPVDLIQVLVLLVGSAWISKGPRQQWIPLTPGGWRAAGMALAAAGFVWLNAMVARTVHHWAGVGFRADLLAKSFLFQAAVSILWGVAALAAMVWGSRSAQRGFWFVGAGLLALVVLKLFVVDLSGTGTVARIVSFLAVGLLMLAIGFFSPAPPSRKTG